MRKEELEDNWEEHIKDGDSGGDTGRKKETAEDEIPEDRPTKRIRENPFDDSEGGDELSQSLVAHTTICVRSRRYNTHPRSGMNFHAALISKT